MVRAVRRGASLRSGARQFHVSPTTVQRWVERVRGQRLDRAELGRPFLRASTGGQPYASRPGGVSVRQIRHELRDHRDLGEFEAAAIRRELLTRGMAAPPSLRTIGRMLERCDVLDCRHPVRARRPRWGGAGRRSPRAGRTGRVRRRRGAGHQGRPRGGGTRAVSMHGAGSLRGHAPPLPPR